jgi:predicted transcriptional regulator
MPGAKERVPTGLHDMPGHYIRRLQQIAVAVFLQEVESFGVTPIQYAVLQAVREAPGSDQRSLAGMIGLDTSTMAGVVERLESRGLVQRAGESGTGENTCAAVKSRAQRIYADDADSGLD